MKKSALIKIVGIAVLLIATAAIASEMGITPTHTTEKIRYKMTVEVETPEGVKTGSAVREVVLHKGIKMAPEQIADVEVKGEAVVIDLSKRGVLFALLRNIDSPDYATDVFFKAFPPEKRKQGKVTLNPHNYPMFVKFSDLNDPKTVENATIVEKDGMYNEKYSLKKALFGQDVNLKTITLEIVNEPLTSQIEKWLPWLKDMEIKKSRLNGNTGIAISTSELSENLGTGAFRIEE